jgi:hypothetical protein
MSTQLQVNASCYQYVLYYIGYEQKDSGVYPLDLTGICTIGFGEGDVIVITDWTLGDSYPAPSNSTLLGYSPAAVFTWYDGFYADPAAIALAQPVSLTTAQRDNLRTDGMTGFTIMNTTLQKQQYFDGSAWVSMW